MIQPATVATPGGSRGSSVPDTRLRGHWLILARAGWLVVVVLTLAVAAVEPALR